MKKTVLIFITFVCTTIVQAYDFESNGFYFNILSENEVEVTNNGYNTYAGSLNVPASITYESKTYIVTAIGDNAFIGSTRLYGITIPEVKTIGRKAFHGCTTLRKIELPQTLTAIGDFAFSQCEDMKAITIPASVTHIGTKAFMHCISLATLEVESNNTTYCSENNIIYDKTKTSLLHATPTYSGALTIAETVREIGDNAFTECAGLTSVDLSNVETIGDFAFFNCTKLTKIEIPSSVTKIGFGAFMNCSGTRTLSLGTNVTELGGHSFFRCNKMTSVNIACKELKIGKSAFADCRQLSIKELPEGVSEIGEYAFCSCVKLPSMKFPNTLHTIMGRAFMACSNMTKLNFGNSLESIGDSAFYKCERIQEVSITTPEPPSIKLSTFAYATYTYYPLNVVVGAATTYANADYWKKFKIINETAAIDTHTSQSITIYGSDGRIYITGITDPSTYVAVYNISGQKIANGNVAFIGNKRLSRGTYIVIVNGKASKIIL